MKKFTRSFWKLGEQLVVYVCGPLVLVQMMYVTVNVIGRYAFRIAVPRTTEMVSLLMVPIALLGAPRGWRTRGTFVSIDILTSRMPRRTRQVLDITYSFFAMLTYVLILSISTLYETVVSYRRHDVMGAFANAVVTWPFRLIMGIGLVLMAIQMVLGIRSLLRGGTIFDVPPEVKEKIAEVATAKQADAAP